MHQTSRAVLIDLDRPGPPLRPVTDAWPPTDPATAGLRAIAAAAAAAGFVVLGTSRHQDRRNIWATAHDRAVHIDDTLVLPVDDQPAQRYLPERVEVVATRPDGLLASRLPTSFHLVDPTLVDPGGDADDPDGPLAWAVPTDGWHPIRHVRDVDGLQQLLIDGRVHSGSRPGAQDLVARQPLPRPTGPGRPLLSAPSGPTTAMCGRSG